MTPIQVHVIIHNMMGGDVNPHPILVLVNYWEIRPSRLGQRLDELLKSGISHFITFVPWQAVESDISHTLSRLLLQVSTRRMTVSLILSPEVGIHYPNSGIPKDVISKEENMAHHFEGGRIPVTLPPNAFTLPSFFAPEFNKRYYGFLARMDGFFSDLSRNQPELMKGVQIVLTGSLWKYYRSAAASSKTPFGGSAGDFSSQAGVLYRQRVEHFYTQKEFTDPNPAAANRWKTRTLEEVNRRWFYQQSEEIFRNRSLQSISKRSPNLRTLEIELFTPEADPGLTYSTFLQMIAGGKCDFSKLSAILDAAAARISMGTESQCPPYVHWTSMGGFRSLSEPERQFLFLKSLLLFGGQRTWSSQNETGPITPRLNPLQGGILIDEEEWFTFSPNFRVRAEALARSLSQGELAFNTRALYLTPHLWSSYGPLWENLYRRLGPSSKMVSSIDWVVKEKSAQLLLVDPSVILTRESIQKLTAWAKAGRVVALPSSKLFTEAARSELEKAVQNTKRIEVDLGLSYRLHAMGDGKLIIYQSPDPSENQAEPTSSWQTFLNAVLSIADIESFCRLSDSRLMALPFERKGENNDNLAIFVLNGTQRSVSADLIFPLDVRISDLGIGQKGRQAPRPQDNPPMNRFTLDVPPMGVLPMAVDGLNLSDMRERQIAAALAQETMESVKTAAISELPGLDDENNWL